MEGIKKVFVVLLDGVSLRNFVYTDFPDQAKNMGLDLIFWNATPLDLSTLGLREIKFDRSATNAFSQPFKMAKNSIELGLNAKLDNEGVNDLYQFPTATTDVKSIIKVSSAKLLKYFYNSESGSRKITKIINDLEIKTEHFQNIYSVLKKEKPDFVLFANQRHLAANAAVTAARHLNIPTATFIFSWDNLPKATLLVEADYYFVWSEYMKEELLKYYNFIDSSRVKVTGTPQFVPHTNSSLLVSREKFCARFGLDSDKKYICFSGDDITTSPYDNQYLRDVAKAVRELNNAGNNFGIIFRRCPVDFSRRFEKVLTEYSEIVSIDPDWQNQALDWGSVIPNQNDIQLLMNTIFHSEMVINLGSSMVFDYAAFNKPCGYICYNVPSDHEQRWSVEKIYRLKHFTSMPSPEAVVWLDDPETISTKILTAIENPNPTVSAAKNWFERIVNHPLTDASANILNEIELIIERK